MLKVAVSRKRILKRLDERFYLKQRDVLEDEARDSTPYKDAIATMIFELNALQPGDFQEVDMDWLEQQFGHLIFFVPKIPEDMILNNLVTIKETMEDLLLKEKQMPIDVGALKDLFSHIRNMCIIRLRKISKYLMNEHRTILAELIETQTRQRSLKFESLNLRKEVTALERKVTLCEAKAHRSRLKTTKLDHFAAALRLVNSLKCDYRYLVAMIRDPHHIRRNEANDWMKALGYHRVQDLETSLKKTRKKINRIFEDIISKMGICSGIPFQKDSSQVEGTSFNWYTLGLEVPRNEYFTSTYRYEERTNQKLKRKTFYHIKILYDEENFRARFNCLQPTGSNYHVIVPNLASLFFNVRQAIDESSNQTGEVAGSLKLREESGISNRGDLEIAEKWAQDNFQKLNQLQKDILSALKTAQRSWSDVSIPSSIHDLIQRDEKQAQKRIRRFKLAQKEKPLISAQLNMLELRAEREQEAHSAQFSMEITAEFEDPNENQEPTLELLLKNYKKLKSRAPFWSLINYSNQEEDNPKTNDDFETVLKHETEMDDLLKQCEDLIVFYYHSVPYSPTFPEIEQLAAEERDDLIFVSSKARREAFEIAHFRNIGHIRQLDYSGFDAQEYRKRFERTLELDTNDMTFMLERLFHEIRCLPRSDQLVSALIEWADNFSESDLNAKEAFILKNNDALILLMGEIRAKLRDGLIQFDSCSRQLRMEVFGLGDFFAGNLEDIFFAQFNSLSQVATPKELKLMLQSIEAIETQIHEAQKGMEPDGPAQQRLNDLEKSKVFDDQFIGLLAADLDENAQHLSRLLKTIAIKMDEVAKIKQQIDAGKDDDYLTVVIEHADVESLRQTYTFLENIAPAQLKRFALAYRRKVQIIDRIIEGNASELGIQVPFEINSKIGKDIRKGYKKDKRLPPDLRLAMLDQIPITLEADCRLLAYTLNFVKFGNVSEKVAYKIPLKILEMATHFSQSDDRRRAARRYWAHLRNYLEDHKPASYEKNYENNLKAFFTDKETLIGSKL